MFHGNVIFSFGINFSTLLKFSIIVGDANNNTEIIIKNINNKASMISITSVSQNNVITLNIEVTWSHIILDKTEYIPLSNQEILLVATNTATIVNTIKLLISTNNEL